VSPTAAATWFHDMRQARHTSLYGVSSVLIAVFLVGCNHRQVTPYRAPATAPPIARQSAPAGARPAPTLSAPSAGSESGSAPSEVSADDEAFISSHKPIYSEEGVASWYGPPYHNHQGANGKIFDQNAMTAAHRTLPMGSLITVTNEKTGQSATMRITDRGPFVQGRLLDLSMGSAKATGVYRAGLANVRVDVYETPRPMDAGGRWCVQIGAFEHEHKATKLREQLEREYDSAQVIDFQGPTGYWVRIRPRGDNREQAESIAKRLRPAEGDAYLVRLD
jgi:rare lipoprotein A